MKKILLLTGFVISALWCTSQKKESIVTDRPSQSASSAIVPAGNLQLETGYILEQDEQADGTNFNLLLRWGLNEFVELRFQQDYLTTDTEVASFRGLSATKLGIKSVIAKEESWMPEIALLGSLTFPSGEGIYQTRNNVPEFAFSTSKSFSDRFAMGYNLGMRWDDDSPEHTTFYTLIFGWTVSDQVALFFEPYGFLRKETKADSRLNGGLTYLLKPSIQLDVSGGIGLTDQSPDSFVSFGAAAIF